MSVRWRRAVRRRESSARLSTSDAGGDVTAPAQPVERTERGGGWREERVRVRERVRPEAGRGGEFAQPGTAVPAAPVHRRVVRPAERRERRLDEQHGATGPQDPRELAQRGGVVEHRVEHGDRRRSRRTYASANGSASTLARTGVVVGPAAPDERERVRGDVDADHVTVLRQPRPVAAGTTAGVEDPGRDGATTARGGRRRARGCCGTTSGRPRPRRCGRTRRPPRGEGTGLLVLGDLQRVDHDIRR